MAKPPRRAWLLKSEPDVYGLDRLQADGQTLWDGVRNYQARNHLRAMAVGDLALFYHSNAAPPAVAGVARVVREAYPDPTQFDPDDPHHDPRSPADDPRWSAVDVAFVEAFPRPVTLPALRADPALEGMEVLRKGQRLSVMPVDPAHFRRVVALGGGRTRL